MPCYVQGPLGEVKHLPGPLLNASMHRWCWQQVSLLSFPQFLKFLLPCQRKQEKGGGQQWRWADTLSPKPKGYL
jgi:hypothetical protein